MRDFNRLAFFHARFHARPDSIQYGIGWKGIRDGKFFQSLSLLLLFGVLNGGSSVACAQAINRDQEEVASVAKVQQWIKELGHQDYFVRLQAQEGLIRSGKLAFQLLNQTTESDDLETRLSIKEILARIKINWVEEDDPDAVKNLLFNYQSRSEKERLAIVDQFRWLSTEDTWQALVRISLYDRSSQVSNHAAITLLEIIFLRDSLVSQEIQVGIRNQLKRRFGGLEKQEGGRTADRLFGFFFSNAEQAKQFDLDAFTRVIREGSTLNQEVRLLKIALEFAQKASGTESRIFDVGVELINGRQINLEEAGSALLMFSRLALDHQRWSAIAGLQEKISGKAELPIVQFMAAEALRLQGKTEQSQAIVEKIIADRSASNLLVQSQLLEQNGLIFWAAYVLQRSLLEQVPNDRWRLRLAELEFELGNLDPSLVIVSLLKLKLQAGSDQALLADIFLLEGKIYLEKQDHEKAKESFLKSLQQKPNHIPSLIALFKATANSDQSKLTEIKRKIASAEGQLRDSYRSFIAGGSSPFAAERKASKYDFAITANSLAWLLANTDGDLDEASRFARQAVNSSPRTAAFLDTMAFCEFQRGNIEAAIAAQRRAIFISPYDVGYQQSLKKYLAEK